MRKIQVLVLALFAVFAFGAIAATAALAEEATQLLISGNPATLGQLLLSTGELLLADHKGGLFGEEVMLLCSGENLAEVLTATDIDITSIFPLGGKDEEKGSAVTCALQTGTCEGSSGIATPVHIPWLVELMLTGSPALVVSLLLSGGTGNPGWTVTCAFKVEDECSASETEVEVKNETGGTVVATFKETAGTCTRGGAGQGLVEGSITFSGEETSLIVEVMGS